MNTESNKYGGLESSADIDGTFDRLLYRRFCCLVRRSRQQRESMVPCSNREHSHGHLCKFRLDSCLEGNGGQQYRV